MLASVINTERQDRHTHDYVVVADRTLLHAFGLVGDFNATAYYLVILEEEAHNILF